MQNQYVGDVGDFGKYGLLRALCEDSEGSAALSLGVAWYLVPNESHKGDGKHVSYLSRRGKLTYRACDSDLYDSLRVLVRSGRRCVEAIQKSNLLPKRTAFFDAPLTFDGMPGIGPRALRARVDHRNAWFDACLEATEDRDLVFVDPDNGLETKSVRRSSKYGPKYVYLDELAPYLERGQSLVVYHHLGRSKSALAQVKDRFAQISEHLVSAVSPFALLYHRGTARAFFVLPTGGHHATLLDRAQRLVNGPWGEHGHFELVRTVEA